MSHFKKLLLCLMIMLLSLSACTQKNPEVSQAHDTLVNVTASTGWAMVAPGEDLTLIHNLNRSNLTFVGAYSENGKIYQYGQYEDRVAIKAPKALENSVSSIHAAATLQNGNVVLAYKDDMSGFGKFVILNSLGEVVKTPVIFSPIAIGDDSVYSFPSIAVLQNGNFVIAYKEKASTKGFFTIFDVNGTRVRTPTAFSSTDIDFPAVAALNNGKFVIAFRDRSNSYYGKYTIFNASGNLDKAETTFEYANSPYISIAVLNNGNFVIAYRDEGNASQGTFIIFNENGLITKTPTVFSNTATTYTSIAVLKNSNWVISYNSTNGGNIILFNQNGDLERSPVNFAGEQIYYISCAPLKDGNIVISYASGPAGSQYAQYSIYDYEWARFFAPARRYVEKNNGTDGAALSNYPALNVLNNGNFMLSYRDNSNSNYPTYTIQNYNAQTPRIELEVIDNNRVRLINGTYETLKLFLGVNAQ